MNDTQNAECVVVELVAEDGEPFAYCETHHQFASLCEQHIDGDESG